MNEKLREQKMISEAPFFIWATLGYALFFVLCLYDNVAGITFPLFTAGTIFYFILCMKHLSVPVKKFSIFYITCIELLGLSTCLTDSWVIILLNKLAIFFLIIVFLLHNFFENKHWNFLDHIKAYFLATLVPIIFVGKPFVDFIHYRKIKSVSGEEKKTSKIIYVVLGVIFSIPLVVIVLALLISADAVFENVFDSMFEDMNIFTITQDAFLMGILFVVVFFGAYMLISFMSTFKLNENKQEKTGLEPLIAITICSILSFIYVIFSGIQVVYLFIGSGANFILPYDMTYAEYAREGFFQLLFVCLINLVFVLMGIHLFRESKVLKALLCVITSCTYIMIASSAMRMLLYIQYKYLTFLRVFVLWALLVIALVMIGTMISIFKKNFNFFRYSTIVVISLYLILSFARVDYWIAKVNIDNMEYETQYEFFEGTELYDDYDYLFGNLSYDAAPVTLNYSDYSDPSYRGSYVYKRNRYINIIVDVEDMGIRDFNVSKAVAKYIAENTSYYLNRQ